MSDGRNSSTFSAAKPRSDLIAGFLVFLIALPLCLGIAMASGYPPIAGVATAIVGGLVSSFLGSARLTIKGPAAGLIVIALGAVNELGAGDMAAGYRYALAVGVVAAVIQIALALLRAGFLGSLMPPSVVHGMLAAIGVIIIAKQSHVLMGVAPEAGGPLQQLAEIPHSLSHSNPEVFLVGLIALIVLFAVPSLPARRLRRVPAPLVVLLVAIPLELYFDFAHTHTYAFQGEEYELGPWALVQLPGNLLDAVVLPDFSKIGSPASIKYVVMFTMVGTIESLLSASAVDSLDPAKRASNMDRDLFALGVGNLVAASIGGLPMISEIVRSKANLDAGATSPLANFFHGLFMLLFVALMPGLLQHIPLAALAAMLIYTGVRLASPSEFAHAWKVGPEQLLLFVTTLIVTLATDLLLGVAAGIALKVVLHLLRGVPMGALFRSELEEFRSLGELRLRVHGCAVFTNFLGLERRLEHRDSDVCRVVLDFEDAVLVDHTVLERIHHISDEWEGCELVIVGLDRHRGASAHPRAARCKR